MGYRVQLLRRSSVKPGIGRWTMKGIGQKFFKKFNFTFAWKAFGSDEERSRRRRWWFIGNYCRRAEYARKIVIALL